MFLVATLISNPTTPVVDDHVIKRASSALAHTEQAAWLEPGIAVDIPFSAHQSESRASTERIRELLAQAPIDVVVQPVTGRRKKLLLTDMDSTMIGQECIDELADYAGVKREVAAITERAMRGEVEFESALRERVALLKGLPVSLVAEVIRSRIRVNPGALTLVATMRRHGAYACLVTGGFTLFTNRIAAMLGFDESRANTLIVNGDDVLTGEVAKPIFARDGKLATLKELTLRLNLRPDETLVAGDGANDLDMIAAAGLGVAYHAKPKVAQAAAARIDHGDLTALLYAQGYRREEFVITG